MRCLCKEFIKEECLMDEEEYERIYIEDEHQYSGLLDDE